MNVKVGDKITIIRMKGEPQMGGKSGKVTHIDDIGQIHGTWSGLAIVPDMDQFEVQHD